MHRVVQNSSGQKPILFIDSVRLIWLIRVPAQQLDVCHTLISHFHVGKGSPMPD